MTFSRTLAAALLAAGIACSSPASAAADPSHYLLTHTVIEKFKSFEKDTRKDERDDDGALNPRDADDLIRKLDKDPAAKAALARHGLTTREFALATFALLHAGFHVAMEGAMDKKKAADTMAGYTQEQRANIELVRKMQK